MRGAKAKVPATESLGKEGITHLHRSTGMNAVPCGVNCRVSSPLPDNLRPTHVTPLSRRGSFEHKLSPPWYMFILR